MRAISDLELAKAEMKAIAAIGEHVSVNEVTLLNELMDRYYTLNRIVLRGGVR